MIPRMSPDGRNGFLTLVTCEYTRKDGRLFILAGEKTG